MSIPISVGISGAQAADAQSGGPFDVQSDIVFGNSGFSWGGSSGGSAPYAPNDPYSTSTSQTPTSSATGSGPALANAPGGVSGVATSGSSIYLWLALAAAGGFGIWILMKHKKT